MEAKGKKLRRKTFLGVVDIAPSEQMLFRVPALDAEEAERLIEEELQRSGQTQRFRRERVAYYIKIVKVPRRRGVTLLHQNRA